GFDDCGDHAGNGIGGGGKGLTMAVSWHAALTLSDVRSVVAVASTLPSGASSAAVSNLIEPSAIFIARRRLPMFSDEVSRAAESAAAMLRASFCNFPCMTASRLKVTVPFAMGLKDTSFA